MGKCRFKDLWLENSDGNGFLVKQWGKKHNDEKLFCGLCQCFIIVSGGGFQAIKAHAQTEKHKDQCKIKLSAKQLRLAAVHPLNVSDVSGNAYNSQTHNSEHVRAVQLCSARDKTTAAEIFWALKCVVSDYSAASCDGVEDIFRAMFQEGVPEDFCLKRSKFSYLLTYGIAPYFRQELYNDLTGAFFCIYFDETTNKAGVKELQLGVRYWSKNNRQVVSHYLHTNFIGKATAEVLKEKIEMAMNSASLSYTKLLMIGSDGPTVNQKVLRLFSEDVKSCRKTPLIDLGTCNIHILHNAFLKGLDELGDDASQLVSAVYSFFNNWPSRCEDFEKIQDELGLPNHAFIKHCSSRWLTLEGAATRLLEQWKALLNYFLKFVPNKKKDLAKKSSYLRIVRMLQCSTVKSELHFVCSSAEIFTRFTGFFQREEPLIHILHAELHTLAKIIMGRICKPAAIKEFGVSGVTLKKENLLFPGEIVCGEKVSSELKEVNEKQRLVFLSRAQDHFLAACQHLLTKSSLKSKSLLKNFRCLQPQDRVSLRSTSEIIAIAKALPVDVDIDLLCDEWKMLKEEKDKEGSRDGRIDVYWEQFFSLKKPCGDILKYPTVAVVVRASLALSHGQADVERSFSASRRTLSEDRASMSEKTLDAYMVVKSAMKSYKNCPHYVVMSKELLASAHSAHSKYRHNLEEEKEKAMLEEKKNKEREEKASAEKEKLKQMRNERKTIENDEEILKRLRQTECEKRKTADKLFHEANKRLKTAICKKDLEEISLAQAMIEGAQNVTNDAVAAKQQADVMNSKLEKKKAKLITSFFSKESK